MLLLRSHSVPSSFVAVDEGDRSARNSDRVVAGEPTYRRVPDRRHLGDRRATFRGGRRATERVPQSEDCPNELDPAVHGA